MIKKFIYALLLLFIIAIAYFFVKLYPQLPIASAYAAKTACACSFISDRDEESILGEDLGFSPVNLAKIQIDRIHKRVTSSVFGMAKKTAEFRQDVGCVLIDGKDDYHVEQKLARPLVPDSLNWPLGNQKNYNSFSGKLDRNALDRAISLAFDSDFMSGVQKTRAVLVVHESQIVGEKYAAGIDENTPLIGWSMTKSICSTLIGILHKNGKLNLDERALFTEWTDERKDISLKDMLQMQSGLEFGEAYDKLSDATNMLFNAESVSSIPMSKKLIHNPGTHWSYSSGTSNLLSQLIRNRMSDDPVYLRFPYDSLFHRIGMNSAVVDTDETGTFIASSYAYATARDWARFGLLYLRQGNWYGDQIIDSSWVDFVRLPAQDSRGIYGGQFWLNRNHSAYPDVPEEMFFCNGFQGQYVFIIPSYDLIVVRLGLAEEPAFDPNHFLSRILSCFRENPQVR